jgi:hypothetical protein
MDHVPDMTKDLPTVVTGVLPGVTVVLLADMVDLLLGVTMVHLGVTVVLPGVTMVPLGVTAVLRVATAVHPAEHTLSMEKGMHKATTTSNPRTEVCYQILLYQASQVSKIGRGFGGLFGRQSPNPAAPKQGVGLGKLALGRW